MPPLTARERSFLKARAHPLEPIVHVGHEGLTEAVLNEVDNALIAHELIKVRVTAADRTLRRALCDEILRAHRRRGRAAGGQGARALAAPPLGRRVDVRPRLQMWGRDSRCRAGTFSPGRGCPLRTTSRSDVPACPRDDDGERHAHDRSPARLFEECAAGPARHGHRQRVARVARIALSWGFRHALPAPRPARVPPVFLSSSTAEHPAVNRRVAGSNPA